MGVGLFDENLSFLKMYGICEYIYFIILLDVLKEMKLY